MTEFNSNLNNLFKNYQQKQMYQKYQDASAKDKKNKDLWKDIDVNGDGKITSKDFSKLNSTEKSLLKKTKLFDVNGDGKFNQTDIDMFVKGDVDGDGKITEEELNFVSEYKDDLLSVFTNKKASFVLDGKKYVKGDLANGIISGKYYKDGALATGTIDGKYYYKGKLANSTIGGKMYQNGVLANDTVNGKLYKNGVLFSGTDSGKLYKNGVLFSGTQNNKVYQAGVLANGTVNGKTYKDGIEIKIVEKKDNGKLTRYEYNAATGNLIKESRYDSKGVLLSMSEYNSDGKLIEKRVDGKIAKYEYDSETGNLTKESRYDSKGVLLSMSEYNSDGKVIEKRVDGKIAKYEYDSETGNLTKESRYDSKGVLLSMSEYNSDGKVIEKRVDGKIAKYDSDSRLSYLSKIVNNEKITLSRDEIMKYLSEKSISFSYTGIDIREMVLDDIIMVKYAQTMAKKVGKEGSKKYNAEYNSVIKSFLIKNEKNMTNTIGEIVEKKDSLYVNDGNELIKLNISAETYLKLFPPIERYDIRQGCIGDCYFISGCLIDMMKNQKAFSQLIQMFSENENGDISIKFAGTLGEYSQVTFEKGELKIYDYDEKGNTFQGVQGALGIIMLEQAYAISRFAKDCNSEIMEINIDKIDESLCDNIYGGWQSQVYEEVLGCKAESTFMSFVPEDIIKQNQEKIEKIEPILIEFLKKEIELKKIEEFFKTLDFMNNHLYRAIFVITQCYHYQNNKNIFEDCTLNGEYNLAKIKDFISDNSFKNYIANLLQLNDQQFIKIINKAIECDLYNSQINYNNIRGEFYELTNKFQEESLSRKIYDYSEADDIISINNTIQAINNNGLYNLLLNEINSIADKVNSGEILLGASANEGNDEYGIVGNHAYSVEKIDKENKIVYVINPWLGCEQIKLSYNLFFQYFTTLDYGYLGIEMLETTTNSDV